VMSLLRSMLAVLVGSYLVLVTPLASADPPHISYIFPAGGQRGTTVRFHVGGHYLRDRCPFEMLGPGILGPLELKRTDQTLWFEGPRIPMPASQAKEDYPREQWGQLKIDSSATAGFRRWRVWTSQGVTSTMKFVVGDLPEIVEEEIDGATVPQSVELPVTINGRIFPREDIDLWTFQAKAGQHYVCEVMAQRLGSPLDSRLVVLDPSGQPVAENTDGIGKDALIRFQAAQDGVYQVQIQDVEFGGLQHYVYRLSIREGFFVDHVYPLGGRRGATIPVQLFSRSGDARQIQLTMPKTDSMNRLEPVRVDGKVTNRFQFDVGDLPEFQEDPSAAEKATGGTFDFPAVVNGRISQLGQVDSWRFTGKKDVTLLFDLMAERLGSPLDSVMRLLDADGKQVARSDDMSKNESDSRFEVKLPRDGGYTIEVKERFARRGGLQYAYRLYVAPKSQEAPSFSLQLPTDGVTLNRGGEAKLKITATRRGGFSGPIELDVLNLPWGVTAQAVSIAAKKNDATLVLKSHENAKVRTVRIQVMGSGEIEPARQVAETARTAAGSTDDMELDHCMLAVSMATPFKVVGEFETKYAARGSTYRRHYRIERGGFAGPLEIRMADRQVRHLQGIQGGSVIVPAGQSEFDYAVHLAPWMEVGRTSRTCVTAIGFLKDEEGKEHEISYTSHEQNDQVILLVDPGQLDVKIQPRSVAWSPGASLDLAVQLGRGQGLNEAARVELVVPSHIQGVHAEPLIIPAGKTRGVMKIYYDKTGHGPFNMPLTVRATVLVNREPYTAERKLDVFAPR
jgi:hypothetical protein